jgi:dTDP-3-amino-3,4,6-trideoxy-alpha-D-glucose transaminase
MGLTRVSLNDFTRQWTEVSQAVVAAVERVGASGWFILGEEVKVFEATLASRWGLRHAVGSASGTDALEIALRIIGVLPGQKVLTTPLSAFATTLALMRVGAIPIYTDVDSSGLLDLDRAETLLAQHPDIGVIVPVHLFGHSLNLDHLDHLKNRFNLAIIEDCAQSIDARSGTRAVGHVGQIAATSFYPTKNMGCLGDGGALLTSDDHLATRARSVRDYGQTHKYIHSEFGLNSRLDELQAAILLDAFLPRLSEWTARRRQIAESYKEQLAHSKIAIPPAPDGSRSVWHLFPVLIAGQRDSFRAHLERLGVATGIHYPILITEQRALAQYGRFQVLGSLDRAQAFVASEVSIPIHPFLTDAEVQQVIDACNSWSD